MFRIHAIKVDSLPTLGLVVAALFCLAVLVVHGSDPRMLEPTSLDMFTEPPSLVQEVLVLSR